MSTNFSAASVDLGASSSETTGNLMPRVVSLRALVTDIVSTVVSIGVECKFRCSVDYLLCRPVGPIGVMVG